jgi:biopolymer transport protein ExbD
VIGSKKLRVGTFNKHLMARAHKKKAFKRMIVAGLMLTSMVDMFSLLVIFLLQSFSASPEVMAMGKGITLPAAISARPPIDAPVLAISSEDVALDQKPLGTPSALLNEPQSMLTQLQKMRDVWQAAHPTEAFKGDIHLQADKALSSTMISQFISILISQGYSTVHLAVASGSGK